MAGYTPVIPGANPHMSQAYIAQQAAGSAAVPTGVLDASGVGNVAVAAPDVSVGTFWRNGDGSFNTGNLQLALGGIQTLGALWNSYQQNKLAKESLSLQHKAFETNLENQTKVYNTSLEDRIRSRYATEGRSDEADAYIAERSL